MNPQFKPAATPAGPGAAAAPNAAVDDMLARAGRWLLAKVWLGCVLSGAYAVGRHFGWPQALLTTAAVLGAVALSLAAWWLPLWTIHSTTGIAVVDVSLRIIVWGSLAACVVALLIGMPGVGAVAGALLISTATRTFHPKLKPLLRRYGLSLDRVRYTSRVRHVGWSPTRGRGGTPLARDVHAGRPRPAGDTGNTSRPAGNTSRPPGDTGRAAPPTARRESRSGPRREPMRAHTDRATAPGARPQTPFSWPQPGGRSGPPSPG